MNSATSLNFDVAPELAFAPPTQRHVSRSPGSAALFLAVLASVGAIAAITPRLGLLDSALQAAEPAPPLATIELTADFTPDLGQRLGSLFEIRDDDGRVVAGAGFAEVYNTRFRSGRHTLQFFVRPAKDEDADALQQTRLPHPDLDWGVYPFELSGAVTAWTSARNHTQRTWDSRQKQWGPPVQGRLRSGDGVMRLGNGTLTLANNRAVFNGEEILAPPTAGQYYCFYYAQGQLCFFHTVRGDESNKSKESDITQIFACPWKPGEGRIDLRQAAVLTTRYVGETPFCWGQYGDELLTVSNQGGLYAVRDGRWRTVLEADNTVSYQVYSMLNCYDRLLLAQYPTGYVFEYRGGVPKMIEGFPPRMPGVATGAREAQTMTIYRGEVLVGVWPWAELWRYEHDRQKWHSMGRMFTHPQLTDKMTHPYEPEALNLGPVANRWGQRVTGLVPSDDSLFVTTSAKGMYDRTAGDDFINDAQRQEYGAVLQLKMQGNLAAPLRWGRGRLRLQLVLDSQRMQVIQDGVLIGSGPAPTIDPSSWRTGRLHIRWGEGIYGACTGDLMQKSLTLPP